MGKGAEEAALGRGEPVGSVPGERPKGARSEPEASGDRVGERPQGARSEPEASGDRVGERPQGARSEPLASGDRMNGASLLVMRGFYEGLEVPIDRDWLVIGRGRGSDVIFAEQTISRAHAAIGFDGGEFFVQDLGSTNGTRVNGVRQRRAALADGDEIQLGKLRFKLSLPR
jgi:pSer/pThr/pTyr-binding forkhead associated (FHA) protein